MVTTTGRRGLAVRVSESPFAMMPTLAVHLTRLAGGVERQEDALTRLKSVLKSLKIFLAGLPPRTPAGAPAPDPGWGSAPDPVRPSVYRSAHHPDRGRSHQPSRA